MSRSCASWLFLVLLTHPLVAAPLTLEDVLQRAIVRSEPLQQAQLETQRQATAVDEAKSAKGSRVTLDADLDTVARQVNGRDPEGDLEPSVRTEWRYPLYDGGGRAARIEAARGRQEAARWDLAHLEDEIRLQGAELFYTVLGLEQDLANLKESEGVYRDRIASLQQRARIGRSRRAEVLAAESQMELVQAQIAAVRQNLRAAQSRLGWLVGHEGKLSLRDTVPLDQNSARDTFTRQTLAPSLAAAQARVTIAEQRLLERQAAPKPQIDVIGSHRWAIANDVRSQTLIFGVGLTWTLYDAGGLKSGLAGLTLEKQQAQIQEQWLRRQTDLDLSLARQALEDGLVQIKDLERAYRAADQNVRLQQQEFENGLLTNLELMQAIDVRLQVKRNLDQVKNRTKRAYVEALLRSGLWPKQS